MRSSLEDSYPGLPEEKRAELDKAVRLEIWTLFFLGSIVIVMYLAMGSSQAMKTAWIEDLLSLLPPALFLLAAWLERKPANKYYPFGYHRFGSLAFFASAIALLAMGLYLIIEAALTLVHQEHPTIGSKELFGRDIWNGWLMIAALVYSVIPPVILGRLKQRPSRSLQDKILHTDADMNAADWRTGVAGVVGVTGIAFGYWWADATAAALIATSILHDGFKNCRIAFAELIDGAPRELDSREIHPTVQLLEDRVKKIYPNKQVRARETGRFISAVIVSDLGEEATRDLKSQFAGDEDGWRLLEVSQTINVTKDRE